MIRVLLGLLGGAGLVVLLVASCGQLNMAGIGRSDICNNIEGAQTNIPAGLVADGRGGCVVPSQAAAPAAPAQSQSQQSQAQQPAAAAPAAAQQSAPAAPAGEHPSCPKNPGEAASLLGGTPQNWNDLGTGGRTWRKWKFDGRGQTLQLRYPGWGSYDDYHPQYGDGYKGNVTTNEATFNCHM